MLNTYLRRTLLQKCEMKLAINYSNSIQIQQRNDYISLPILAMVGTVAGIYGSYHYVRNRYKPLISRPLHQVMNQTAMIGHNIHTDMKEEEEKQNALIENLLKNMPAINPETKQEIQQMRRDTIMKLRNRFGFQFLSGNLYFRPITMDDVTQNVEERADDVALLKLMHDYGICHAYWILNAGPTDYILDFVREGIRFEMIDSVNIDGDQNTHALTHHISCFPSAIPMNVNSHLMVDWIEDQYNFMKYDVFNNHCLHFVVRFGQHFVPEKFQISNEVNSENIHSSSLFTSYAVKKHMNLETEEASNEQLLDWTRNVIARSTNK